MRRLKIRQSQMLTTKMKIKITMSIQNAPFENVQPELEIDLDDPKDLELVDRVYKIFHGRHTDESKKGV